MIHKFRDIGLNGIMLNIETFRNEWLIKPCCDDAKDEYKDRKRLAFNLT